MSKQTETLRDRWELVVTWLDQQKSRSDEIGELARSFRGAYPSNVVEWMDWQGGCQSLRGQLYGRAMLEFNQVHPFEQFDSDGAIRCARRVLAGKPPRIRRGATGVGPRMRAYVLERDDFTCRRCGAKPSRDDVQLVVDHVVPVAKGGTGDHSNLQTLCWDCNSGKSDRQPHPHDLRPR